MRFDVLGTIRMTGGSAPDRQMSEHRRRLLAVFLAHGGGPVASDALAGVLWGSNPPSRPDKSLQMHLVRLRQTLDRPDRLRTVPGGYLLDLSPGELDAEQFLDLRERSREAVASGDVDLAVELSRRALALWRGDPYADVDEPRFVAPAATRLAEARLLAYEELYEAELSRGAACELVPELTRLSGEYPLRERICGQLMLALYRSGRRTRALAAFRRISRRLADELRTEPGRDLRALHEAIRNDDVDSPRLR